MMRRLTFATLFLLVGFVAGLVLTGRMRTAEDASAQVPIETPDQGKGAAPPTRTVAATVASTVAGMPDLTNAAAARDRQRAQHLLDVGRPHGELAVCQRPILQGLLRGKQPLRIPGAAAEKSRFGRRRVDRRLCPDQQSRRRRRTVRCVGDPARQARAARQDRRHRRGDGPCRVEDRRQEPAGAGVGRFLEAEGRRVGTGSRQSVRRPQSDRHPRHRQRDRAQPGRHGSTRTSFRPTRRSIRETPAAH